MSVIQLDVELKADYLRLLEQQYALRASASQAAQIDRTVLGLLRTTPFTQPAELYAALAAGLYPDLLQCLATSLTIGETHFFRVMPQIDALRRVVLPDLLARHAGDRRLRIWSAGCSTGEEPYTLAMLLCELLGSAEGWDIQLVGTDLNRDALDVARAATFGDWSFRDTPNRIRDRYFTPVSGRWRLNPHQQRMVRFAQLNLAKDPFPFAAAGERPDLILCRNVTIYFGQAASQRLYRRFGAALGPSGWLVLGPSDPVPTAESGLEMVVLSGALFWRRKFATPFACVPVPPTRPAALPAPQPVSQAHRIQLPRATATSTPLTQARPQTSIDSQVHLAAGMLQLEEGATTAAIDSLRRAAFLDASSPLIQFSLGRAFRQQGATSRSRSAFFRARRLLAGVADDQPLPDSEADVGELREAIEAQLADLDRTRP